MFTSRSNDLSKESNLYQNSAINQRASILRNYNTERKNTVMFFFVFLTHLIMMSFYRQTLIGKRDVKQNVWNGT